MNESGKEDDQEFQYFAEQFQRRRIWVREPQHGSKIIGQLLSRKGYGQTNGLAGLNLQWDDAVGKSLGNKSLGGKSRPGVLRRGVLEILVQNSSVMQELMFQKRQLLRNMQQRLENTEIKELKFKIGPLN